MSIRPSIAAAFAILFLACSVARAEQYTIPLFPAPGTSGDPQGVLRIVNDTGEAATVQVYAIADDGTRAGPATIALDATAAAEFDATELQSANAAKGLSGGLGSFSGDVRLMIDSDAPIVPLAFVRASDGTLSAMHDSVRAGSADEGEYRYDVQIFNLSTAVAQASRLRLINAGGTPAAVTIEGRDDGAAATGGTVRLTLPAGGARTLTAQQLEAGGTGLTGQLGAGVGRWRLTVSSDQALRVVNIVESSTGHLNNLSTTAARGAVPADRAGFDDRFVGETAVLEVEGGRSTLTIMENGRFSETVETDGMFSTSEGGYGYAGLGPDAGRLTLGYDDGRSCLANWYFSSRAGGWFASRCAGGAGPDGAWSGGDWSVEGGEDDDGGGGTPAETTHGPGEALPGFGPGSDFFSATSSVGGGASVSGGRDGWTATMGEGGWFQMRDGTRYTCESAGGCEIVDGTVTRGSVTGRAPVSGGGGIDRFPVFPAAGRPGDRTYTVGTAIDALTLPEAAGGNPPLTYSLSPDVPGLSFDAAARSLTGTPTAAGSYAMSYTATDADGDLHTLHFNIEVVAGDADDHGGTIRRLTDHDYTDRYPSWSPDGRRIAFGSYRDGNWEVYVMDADGGNPRRLTDHEASDRYPSWSPDGRRIAFHSNRDGNWEVYVMDADGGNPRRLTDNSATDTFPSWSPDGRRIAFHSNRDGNWEVYVMDADGGNPRNLTNHNSYEGEPSWSPDGRRIAFNSNRDGNWEVYVMDADGANPRRLTDHDADDRNPSWSPDGRRIAFNSSRDGNWEVYVMDADGGNPRRLTDHDADDRNPSWSPDGRRIAFNSYRDGNWKVYVMDADSGGTGAPNLGADAPDLTVESPSVSDSSPAAGASFTLRATVRNSGDGRSAATTLRYYRSTNATISRSDTAVGTDPVGALAASGTSAESISLTAPSSAGTYYYGACVDTVPDESSRTNNCSAGVRVDVTGGADDHGDTFDTATSVAVPSTTPGELEEGKEDGDRDYFRVAVAAAATLTVETTGSTDVFGTLFDGSRTRLATNDDGGSGNNFRIVRQVQAGTYYVEVRGWRPSRTGSYVLRVSAADDTGGDGGDDGQTTFGVGDVLTDLPTGFFGVNLRGGSIRFSGGIMIIDLNNGGYFEYGDYRYTCQAAGGCNILNRVVQSGTIVRTPRG